MRCEEQALDSRAAVVIAALIIWLTPWTVRQHLARAGANRLCPGHCGWQPSREASDGGRLSGAHPLLANTLPQHDIRRLFSRPRVGEPLRLGPGGLRRRASGIRGGNVGSGRERGPATDADVDGFEAPVESTLTTHSTSPTASLLVWRSKSSLREVPSRRHLTKRSYQVCHGPYLSGKSRHGAPVLSFPQDVINGRAVVLLTPAEPAVLGHKRGDTLPRRIGDLAASDQARPFLAVSLATETSKHLAEPPDTPQSSPNRSPRGLT